MTIEQLDERKVLISLCSEDMKSFELEFENMSFYSEHSKRVLLRLLQLACMKAGISAKSKSVLMEALPHKSGCLLLVTMLEEKGPKTYKVKRVTSQVCFVFESAEAMLSTAQELSRSELKLRSNSLWLLEGRYYLIFDYPRVHRGISEIAGYYGVECRCTGIQISRIKESGELLHKGNALEYIGRKIYGQSSEDSR